MINAELLSCSCCGAGIHDTPEENADHGKVPNPHDTGFGSCLGCGGDKKAKSVRRRMGENLVMFYEVRIKILSEKLNDENRQRFMGLSFAGKCGIIAGMIEKEHMI